MSPLASRPHRLTRPRIVLGAVALVLFAGIWMFEWDWLRPPLERYLSGRSGRGVQARHLDVEWGFDLAPTLRLTGVHVENAPWAAKRPFATAGVAAFTVVLPSLWHEQTVVSRLVLVDADIDLERQANGLRNWRLLDPDDVGPGKVRVLTLEAQRSRIRFVNHAIDLELLAASSPADDSARAARASPGESGSPHDPDLTSRVAFEGEYQGAAFSGVALTGRVFSFRRSGVTFPLRGHMVSRGTRVEADGYFTDVFEPGPMDAHVRLSGATISQLHPFLRVHPPPSRPFRVEGQLTQTHDVYDFRQLKGRIGDTTISGEATLDRRGERQALRAALRSDSARLDDLRPLLGLPQREATADALAASETPFNLEALKSFDARGTLDLQRLSMTDAPMVESAHVEAALENGSLRATSIDLGVAGGHALGAVAFDGRRRPPSANAAFEIHALRLERLAPGFAQQSRGAGAIEGRIAVKSHGGSMAALLGAAAGSFSLRLMEGRISNLADAKLGMDYGRVLRTFLRGEHEVAIRCGVAAFDIREGVAKSTTLAFETPETRAVGTAMVDLRRQRVDLLLRPEAKKPGLFTRHAAIRVEGPLRQPVVSVVDRAEDNGGPIAQGSC